MALSSNHGMFKAIPMILGFCAALCTGARGEAFIVKDGEPRASIVIAAHPPRTVDLAARELQTYIEKLSGATLPIGTAPDPALPVTIYIGRSAFTDAQGITDEGLFHGAYRIISGPDWGVLLGRDRDYTPVEPWPRSFDQYPATQAAWEEIYGGPCANPLNFYAGPATSFNRAAGIWKADEGGSLQAVYALLRDWGVRWFMPGDLGEVVPEFSTLALPSVDRTVHPDFAIRNLYWSNRFRVALHEDVLWWLRLGLNDGSSVLGVSMHAHGMRLIHGNQTMQEQHPEFFALYGGRRDTVYRGDGHACFSSPGLFDATVKYLRAVFDHFDEPAMDLWPQDGYRHCECELCAGKSEPELVFGFVDRVARELYETHPDRLITCGAYSSYLQPPESIEKFTPNVAIFIANRGRPAHDHPLRWQPYWDSIKAWQSRLSPSRIIRGENNFYNRRLVIHPRAYAKDLRALKGVSLGDWCEVPRGRNAEVTQWANPGINHLNYYVQSRLLWETGLDLDALLDDYYARFYGPAANAVQAAFELSERGYTRLDRIGLPLDLRVEFTMRLHAAREQAGETVYGQRVAAILDELPSLDALRAEEQARIEARDRRRKAPMAIGYDLSLRSAPPEYQLGCIVDGAKPDVETTFTVGWDDGTLVFDITCREPAMDKLFVTRDIWGGDSVAILLESPFHSYYQIEINSDGAVFDADREYRVNAGWNSQTQVRTERGEDFWRVIARIPVIPVVEGEGDPLHNVVGGKPSAEEPWFFNLGRTRVHGSGQNDRTAYTFAPVGRITYHDKNRFARLVIE